MRVGDCIDGRFEIMALASSGGMGTVYRALDKATGGAVAIKVLREMEGSDATRFGHEARVLAALEHPHIVRYVAHGVAPGGEPFLVMKWLEGKSLEERLSREGLRLEESVDMIRRVAGALGAAHARGIVHRDIKFTTGWPPPAARGGAACGSRRKGCSRGDPRSSRRAALAGGEGRRSRLSKVLSRECPGQRPHARAGAEMAG